MNHQGSLGYQMLNALKAVFHPGHSRQGDKKHHRSNRLIRGIGTMQDMSAVVHQFARFIRLKWPNVKYLAQVTPDMAQAYVAELVRRERSGGTLGRVCATLRKLDAACRIKGIFSQNAPALLPYKSEGGVGGFHSEPRSVAYSLSQASQIIDFVSQRDPASARVLRLMLATGLRVTEACYLRAQDIDLESHGISLNAGSNVNRTKGGRPRDVTYLPEDSEFLASLKQMGDLNPTGHIFKNRRALPDQARAQVRAACETLHILCLGTHGFRKTFAGVDFTHEREAGASKQAAFLHTSRQLGHNRGDVTRQSYLPPEAR